MMGEIVFVKLKEGENNVTGEGYAFRDTWNAGLCPGGASSCRTCRNG